MDRYLAKLPEANWNVDKVVDMLIETKGLRDLVKELDEPSKELLLQAIEDPDTILDNLDEEHAEKVVDRLIELNLLISIPKRLEYLWIDKPPPEKDLELGIGRFCTWQTPLHREVMKRALG